MDQKKPVVTFAFHFENLSIRCNKPAKVRKGISPVLHAGMQF